MRKLNYFIKRHSKKANWEAVSDEEKMPLGVKKLHIVTEIPQQFLYRMLQNLPSFCNKIRYNKKDPSFLSPFSSDKDNEMSKK